MDMDTGRRAKMVFIVGIPMPTGMRTQKKISMAMADSHHLTVSVQLGLKAQQAQQVLMVLTAKMVLMVPMAVTALMVVTVLTGVMALTV